MDKRGDGGDDGLLARSAPTTCRTVNQRGGERPPRGCRGASALAPGTRRGSPRCRAEVWQGRKQPRGEAMRGRSKRFRGAFPPPASLRRILCTVKFVALLEMAFWLGFAQGSAAKYK